MKPAFANPTAPVPAPAPALAARADASGELGRALRNGIALGGSLLATWGVGLVVRLWLPRMLGPQTFGRLTFSDAFASTAFVLVGLGVDVYIRKEIPVRPQHASDFFGGLLGLRAALALLILLGMAWVLALTGRPDEVRATAFAFGLAQLAVSTNDSLAALLHAQGAVGGLSWANVASKLLWALGLVVAASLHAPLAGFAFALLASEATKTVWLVILAQRHLGLRFQLDVRATAAVLLASLPYNLNGMAHTAYARVDVTLLSVLTNDDLEVGWYGAASTLAGLTLLVTPLIGWVLMPLFARAAARSADELFAVTRRALELLLSLAIPACLMIALGAEVWVQIVFGQAYAPAAMSLRLLAPVFVLTYVASVSGVTMVLLNQGWSLTFISLCGLALNPTLNFLLIRPAQRLVGHGGAGCALALCTTEAAVTSAMLVRLGGRTLDRAVLGRVARALAVSAAVVALHLLLRPLGPWRLAADAAAYLALGTAVGALRPDQLLAFFRNTVGRHALLP